MSTSSSASSGTNSTPRMGILVSCKPSKVKSRNTGVPSPTKPAAAVAAPVVARPRTNRAFAQTYRSWAFPAALLMLGLLFLLCLATVGLHMWVLSADESSTVTTHPVASAPVSQHKLPVAQKQAAVAANSKTSATVTTATKKDTTPPTPAAPTPVHAPTTVTESNQDATAEQTSLIPDGPAPVEKIDVAEIEPFSATDSFAKLVKDDACKQGGDSCTPGDGKGSGDFFGTAVTFLASPKIAGDEAVKDHKLLFVLHVSGNFEDPGFT
jgi:hypothetical protein